MVLAILHMEAKGLCGCTGVHSGGRPRLAWNLRDNGNAKVISKQCEERGNRNCCLTFTIIMDSEGD